MIKKDIIQPINDLIEKQAKELKDKIILINTIFFNQKFNSS